MVFLHTGVPKQCWICINMVSLVRWDSCGFNEPNFCHSSWPLLTAWILINKQLISIDIWKSYFYDFSVAFHTKECVVDISNMFSGSDFQRKWDYQNNGHLRWDTRYIFSCWNQHTTTLLNEIWGISSPIFCMGYNHEFSIHNALYLHANVTTVFENRIWV